MFIEELMKMVKGLYVSPEMSEEENAMAIIRMAVEEYVGRCSVRPEDFAEQSNREDEDDGIIPF